MKQSIGFRYNSSDVCLIVAETFDMENVSDVKEMINIFNRPLYGFRNSQNGMFK